MKVYFENSRGIRREIATVENEDEAYRVIYQFCADRKFQVYYSSSWVENNETVVDVGSWSEFFYISA